MIQTNQEEPVSNFAWNGIDVETVGDLGTAMLSVKSPEEAQQFMAAYRLTNEYAEQNIGYISGYYDPETAQRIRQWFAVKHPIFG
jgi:hypothetical protein